MASRQRGRRVMERVQLMIPDLHTERPSEAFAGHAGAALRAGGALHTAFRDFEAPPRCVRWRRRWPTRLPGPAAW
jgi:hypothetical protein